MRLRDGLIAGRSHLLFIALLVALFFLLQWLDEMETRQIDPQDQAMPLSPADPAPVQ